MRACTVYVRDLTLPLARAIAEKLGAMRHDSCSMYEPSLEAKYFHSKSCAIDDWVRMMPLVFINCSLIPSRKAILSSRETVNGSTLIGVDQ